MQLLGRACRRKLQKLMLARNFSPPRVWRRKMPWLTRKFAHLALRLATRFFGGLSTDLSLDGLITVAASFVEVLEP